MKLTKRNIDSLVYTDNGSNRQIIWDEILPGFGCRVYPSGKKSFVLSYRIAGQEKLLTLGQNGKLTVDQARKQALKHTVSILDGHDPLAQRQQARLGETVADLCAAFLEQHAKRRKRTWREDERRINQHILPALGKCKLKAVKRLDISRVHAKVGEQAPYEANRLLALLSVMFEFAIKQGMREESSGNPARRIDKFPEEKRDRWVTHQELPLLAKAIESEKSIYVRAALWLYLLTGARKSEVLSMRWDHVDLSRRVWRLPTTKAGRPHYIPLTEPALEILNQAPKQKDNPYVICGQKDHHHLVNIDKAWRRVRQAAGITDVRLHDLRRTVGSWLVQSGNSLPLIGRVLNHSNTSTTQIYARFAEDQVRTALDEHGKNLVDMAGGIISI
jgi:integrase